MSSSTQRAALLRQKRKQSGLKETTIWLTPEDDKLIDGVLRTAGLKNRSEVIRYALQQAFNPETQMQT